MSYSVFKKSLTHNIFFLRCRFVQFLFFVTVLSKTEQVYEVCLVAENDLRVDMVKHVLIGKTKDISKKESTITSYKGLLMTFMCE